MVGASAAGGVGLVGSGIWSGIRFQTFSKAISRRRLCLFP
jgi:F0F1-type ATP synthase membrane subunit c/vacuolar-type H+-ATPase subunit K